jgi:hypothetical protein
MMNTFENPTSSFSFSFLYSEETPLRCDTALLGSFIIEKKGFQASDLSRVRIVCDAPMSDRISTNNI